jgi:hypothetical protein
MEYEPSSSLRRSRLGKAAALILIGAVGFVAGRESNHIHIGHTASTENELAKLPSPVAVKVLPGTGADTAINTVESGITREQRASLENYINEQGQTPTGDLAPNQAVSVPVLPGHEDQVIDSRSGIYRQQVVDPLLYPPKDNLKRK